MKAVVVDKPGPPDVLKLKEMPLPEVKAGRVLIRVKAFGLNRSEIFTRQGFSPNVKFPRILGIECVGIVEDAPTGFFEKGQQVASIMGGMGRDFDGSYAEYVSVPEENVFTFQSNLDWAVLGAIPEMCQTVWGSLHEGLEIRSGEKILIRGGSSSIGMTATQLCKEEGLTVLATTRNPRKIEKLKKNGVDHIIIDQGDIASEVKKIFPEGVEKVLELIGTKTLLDSLQCAQPKGIVCVTGILGNEWVLKKFEPMIQIPSTVRLTCYMGEAINLTSQRLQEFIDKVVRGEISINIDKTFQIEEIVAAHQYMESNQAVGKLVVRL